MMAETPPSVHWARLSHLADDLAPVPLGGQVVAVMPWIDAAAAQRSATLMVTRAGAPLQVLAVHDDLGAGPVAVWNQALRYLPHPWLLYCAQDAFAGRLWLRFALQALQRQSGARLLAFNDGKWFGELAAFGLVQRQWLDTLYGGALFHPGYAQHYGDTELTLIARQQQVLAYHPHALLVEVDHRKDQKPVNPADRALFRRRAAEGFDQRVTDPLLRSVAA